MISSAPRQPRMIRINITAETTGLPSYHFFFDFEITVSVFLIPESSPDSCVKCYTMFLPFLLIKIDVFS